MLANLVLAINKLMVTQTRYSFIGIKTYLNFKVEEIKESKQRKP